MKRNWKLNVLIFIVLFIILSVAAFYNGLVVKKYTIPTEKLSEGDSVRIVVITDLHNHIYDDAQEELVSVIFKQDPDVIFLVGDIADDYVPLEGTELLLAGIRGIAPVYYVSGNHEYWSGDIKNIKATIRNYSVTVLESNYEQVKVRDSYITIAGVDDPDIELYEKRDFDWQVEMFHAFSELKVEPGFKILLAHRPEWIKTYKEFSFDLVVSGHAHGGQVRIPVLLNGLFAPDQGWFPQYAGGLYKHEALTHIVSRGVSYNPRLPRIFNPPEVVVIDLKGSIQH